MRNKETPPLVNITLEYSKRNIMRCSSAKLSYKHSYEWLNITLILVVTAVLEIIIVVVWIWRQEKRNAYIVERLKGKQLDGPSKDRETVSNILINDLSSTIINLLVSYTYIYMYL